MGSDPTQFNFRGAGGKPVGSDSLTMYGWCCKVLLMKGNMILLRLEGARRRGVSDPCLHPVLGRTCLGGALENYLGGMRRL